MISEEEHVPDLREVVREAAELDGELEARIGLDAKQQNRPGVEVHGEPRAGGGTDPPDVGGAANSNKLV